MDIEVAAKECGIITRIFENLFINCKPLIPVQSCRKAEDKFNRKLCYPSYLFCFKYACNFRGI